jgi:hypothetical protein
MLYILPIQIIHNPKHIVIIPELQRAARIIPTDGRPHRSGIEPSYYGDSVGKWDGDTLVIDTVNFNGRTRLDTIGHPHSDQLHLVQRLSRPDFGHIVHEMIIDDPKTFTRTWSVTRTLTLRTDWEMMEYSCEENNKSLWEGRIKPPKY